MNQSDIDRFWSKVDKTESCWNWTAGVRGKCGYGALKLDGKVANAHRISYEIEHGSVPDGMCVLHKCDNRLCVRPDHLFLGTLTDNVKDMDQKGRRNCRLRIVVVNCLICGKPFNTPARHREICCCSRSCGTKLAWKIKREKISDDQLAIIKRDATVNDFHMTGLYNKLRE